MQIKLIVVVVVVVGLRETVSRHLKMKSFVPSSSLSVKFMAGILEESCIVLSWTRMG